MEVTGCYGKSLDVMESHWLQLKVKRCYVSHWLLWKVTGYYDSQWLFREITGHMEVNGYNGKSQVAKESHWLPWKLVVAMEVSGCYEMSMVAIEVMFALVSQWLLCESFVVMESHRLH